MTDPKDASRTLLVVVFNHRYGANLPALREIYGHRFSDIVFVMPFYRGSDEDVIGGYYSSHVFQAAFPLVLDRVGAGYDYWFVIADDLLLNPTLDEATWRDVIPVTPADAYISALSRFDETVGWGHAHRAASFGRSPGVEWARELPPRDEAVAALERHGVKPRPMDPDKVFARETTPLDRAIRYGPGYAAWLRQGDEGARVRTTYPLAFGYSDLVVIGRDSIEVFSDYAGIFAAANLFVEIATPTALALTVPGRILRRDDATIHGRAFWGEDIDEFGRSYAYDLAALLDGFPAEYLYVHPVKLSRWG